MKDPGEVVALGKPFEQRLIADVTGEGLGAAVGDLVGSRPQIKSHDREVLFGLGQGPDEPMPHFATGAGDEYGGLLVHGGRSGWLGAGRACFEHGCSIQLSTMEPDEIIRLLELAPHPEGGFYRETWRDDPAEGGRGSGTAIYYLLRAGERSRRHRVDAAEVWHHYAGAPLELTIESTPRVLGPDVAALAPANIVSRR